MREMDLIMGRFADAAVAQLTREELADFEQLMEVPDRELLAWVTGETSVPADHDTALFRRMRDFNHWRERTS
jgi:antitoxin CptB